MVTKVLEDTDGGTLRKANALFTKFHEEPGVQNLGIGDNLQKTKLHVEALKRDLDVINTLKASEGIADAKQEVEQHTATYKESLNDVNHFLFFLEGIQNEIKEREAHSKRNSRYMRSKGLPQPPAKGLPQPPSCCHCRGTTACTGEL